MKNKIHKLVMFYLFFMVVFVTKSFGKYSIQEALSISIEIDKTLPTIDITCNGNKESFTNSQIDESIKKSNDIIIETRDNTKVASNEFYFNPSEPKFEGSNSTDFESGDVFTEEGYYKIVVTDTSRNKIEIVVLLDKTAPDVWVEYFKIEKNLSLSAHKRLRQTAGIEVHKTAENFIETNTEEIENSVQNVEQEGNEIGEENQNNTIENTRTNEIDTEIVEDEQNIVSEEKQQEAEEESIESAEDNNEQEKNKVEIVEESQIMTIAASDMYVGNESEFRNALANQASVIHIRQSIDFISPVYINYAVEIVGDGTSNSLRYGKAGNFIVIQQNGALVVNRMVIDTNSSGVSGITAINMQSGGSATFINSSIVDGGIKNTGIQINGAATLLLWSSEIVRCNYGILLKSNGSLNFATQDGRCNNFYWNNISVMIQDFSGNCDFNQNIGMYDNTVGIYTKKVNGTIKISAGSYYNNQKAVQCGGSITIRGGEFYKNTHGIYVDNNYSGKLTFSNGKIYSNTKYSIYQNKTNDGGCTILRRKYKRCNLFSSER